jgi:PDZ domain-containing protein
MWTLGVIDVLTPGELTGGRTIAGTGTIVGDGAVGPIGGVQQKVVAAERAGARVFFVPADNAADARAVAKGITVVPVRTYQDALDYLLAHGGAVS